MVCSYSFISSCTKKKGGRGENQVTQCLVTWLEGLALRFALKGGKNTGTLVQCCAGGGLMKREGRGSEGGGGEEVKSMQSDQRPDHIVHTLRTRQTTKQSFRQKKTSLRLCPAQSPNIVAIFGEAFLCSYFVNKLTKRHA